MNTTTPFHRLVGIFTIVAAIFGAILLTQMGNDYHVIGKGLHPTLVTIGIVVCTIFGHVGIRFAVKN